MTIQQYDKNMQMIIFLGSIALLGGLLWAVFNAETIFNNKDKADMSKLARMSRHARRHNTMMRYHEGMPFVVTHQTRGFVYMIDGSITTREDLIKRLGLEGEAKIAKIEQEEQMVAPSPTRMTVFSPDIKTKPKAKAKTL